MKVEFYIPSDKTIPTRLALRVDDEIVWYDRIKDDFGYDFEFINTNREHAMEVTGTLATIMCNQSYDHGQEWRVVSMEIVKRPNRYDIGSIIVRVTFRIKDSY